MISENKPRVLKYVSDFWRSGVSYRELKVLFLSSRRSRKLIYLMCNFSCFFFNIFSNKKMPYFVFIFLSLVIRRKRFVIVCFSRIFDICS